MLNDLSTSALVLHCLNYYSIINMFTLIKVNFPLAFSLQFLLIYLLRWILESFCQVPSLQPPKKPSRFWLDLYLSPKLSGKLSLSTYSNYVHTEVQFSEKNNMKKKLKKLIYISTIVKSIFLQCFLSEPLPDFFPSGEKTFLVNRTIT